MAKSTSSLASSCSSSSTYSSSSVASTNSTDQVIPAPAPAPANRKTSGSRHKQQLDLLSCKSTKATTIVTNATANPIDRRKRLAANARERKRMHLLNKAYDQLRNRLIDAEHKSKYDVLVQAKEYIQALATICEKFDKEHPDDTSLNLPLQHQHHQHHQQLSQHVDVVDVGAYCVGQIKREPAESPHMPAIGEQQTMMTTKIMHQLMDTFDESSGSLKMQSSPVDMSTAILSPPYDSQPSPIVVEHHGVHCYAPEYQHNHRIEYYQHYPNIATSLIKYRQPSVSPPHIIATASPGYT